jgi:hypothetical protein
VEVESGIGVALEFAGDDEDVFFGVGAEAFLAFAAAKFAGAVVAAHVGGSAAVADGAVGAGALGKGGQLAGAVGLDAQLENALAEAVVEAGGVALILRGLVAGEPAGGGEIFRHDGEGFAEAPAFLDVEALVVIPDRVEGAGVAGPGEVGAEEVAVEVGLGVGDGFVEEGFLCGEEARGAGEGERGDLAGVEDFAGAFGLERVSEEPVDDLGAEKLDGFRIFDQGDGDAGAGGADGKAVDVLDAEIFAADGDGGAMDALDGEGAAAARAFGGFG